MNAVSQHQLDRSEGQKQARWDAGTPVSAKKANQNVGPRLVGGTTFGKNDGIDKAQVVLLADASLQSLEETRKVIVGWQRQGLTLTQIYLNGIAESAKVLGDHWLSDKLSFIECTIGFSRLHQMLHDWLACHWNQWLWNREGVRPHPFSHPSHWHYYLHKQLVKVVAKVQKTKFKTLIMGI